MVLVYRDTTVENDSNATVEATVDSTISNKWIHPKSFEEEPVQIKISLIVKWIYGSETFEAILLGKEKITNIETRLESMKFNGYLRLFEVDKNMLYDLMTDNSKILFEDFETKRKGDAWKCPHCSSIFGQGIAKWKCVRCLFWYHEKCAKPMQVKLSGVRDKFLCNSCFFSL